MIGRKDMLVAVDTREVSAKSCGRLPNPLFCSLALISILSCESTQAIAKPETDSDAVFLFLSGSGNDIESIVEVSSNSAAVRISNDLDAVILQVPCLDSSLLGITSPAPTHNLPTPSLIYELDIDSWVETNSLPQFAKRPLAEPPKCDPIEENAHGTFRIDPAGHPVAFEPNFGLIEAKQTDIGSPRVLLESLGSIASSTAADGVLVPVTGRSGLFAASTITANGKGLYVLYEVVPSATNGSLSLVRHTDLVLECLPSVCPAQIVASRAGAFIISNELEVQIRSTESSTSFSIAEYDLTDCGRDFTYVVDAGANEALLLIDNDRLVLLNLVSDPVVEDFPEFFPLSPAEFCGLRVATSANGVIFSSDRSTVLRSSDGKWHEMRYQAVAGGPGALVPVGDQVVAISSGDAEASAKRLFRSIECDAGLGFIGDRSVRGHVWQPSGTVVWIASNEVEETVDVLELRSPNDIEYRACWDRPLIR